MPDWKNEASRKLANTGFSSAEREEVARELAGYLEEVSSDARDRGLDESAAAQPALAELHEDPHLGANLYRARQEGNMNDRTKQLWLPGLTSLFAIVVMGTLAQQLAGYLTRFGNRENVETSWQVLYFSWFYGLVFIGAAGAYWSRRAGGGRIAQMFAGLFPGFLFLAVFWRMKVAGGGGALSLRYGPFAFPPSFFDGRAFGSIIIPSTALLLGVLPFLLGWGPRKRPSVVS